MTKKGFKKTSEVLGLSVEKFKQLVKELKLNGNLAGTIKNDQFSDYNGNTWPITELDGVRYMGDHQIYEDRILKEYPLTDKQLRDIRKFLEQEKRPGTTET